MRLQLIRGPHGSGASGSSRPLVAPLARPWASPRARVVAACLAAVGATLAPSARAEGNTNTKVRTEVSGYIDSVAVSVLTPAASATVESPTAGWSASGSYLVDVVSAASPDIVSTASPRWSEVRQAGSLGAGYKPGNVGVDGGANFSYSNDYLSLSGGAKVSLDLAEKNVTLSGGYFYGHDVIGRTGTAFSVFSRTLDTHTVVGGVTVVLNPTTLVHFAGDLGIERGDGSKPYRYIPLFTAAVAPTIGRGATPAEVARARIAARPLEQLPLARERYALTARLNNHSGLGTLRLEERIYADTWGLMASTTDARLYFDLSRRVELGPHARFHGQTAVSFWQRAYVARDASDIPALRTGDRELGGLWTAGGGLGLRWAIGPGGDPQAWTLTLGADAYYTSFADALYVTERVSAFSALGLEATF